MQQQPVDQTCMAIEDTFEMQAEHEAVANPLQPHCRLLSLPAELRNRIYEFAFSTNVRSPASPVNILEAKGPEKAWLSTCRQIYKEAQGFWTAALPQYWENTAFFLDGRLGRAAIRRQIEALNEADVKMITNLLIGGRTPIHDFDNGIWSCVGACCRGSNRIYRSPGCPRKLIAVHEHPSTFMQRNLGETFSKRWTTPQGDEDNWFCWVEVDPTLWVDSEVAKQEAGWGSLTKWELIQMVKRYHHSRF